MKSGRSLWKAVKFLIIAAIVCYLVTKIYQKLVAKKRAVAEDVDALDLDLDELDCNDDECVAIED